MNERSTSVTNGGLRVDIVHGNEQSGCVGKALQPFTIKATNAKTGAVIIGAKVDFIPANGEGKSYLELDSCTDHTNERGEASATFVPESSGAFMVTCWIHCLEGSGTIEFTGAVQAQTIGYQDVARHAQPPAAGTRNTSTDETRASRVITLRAMTAVKTDEELDAEMFGTTRVDDTDDASERPIPSAPLPREAAEEDDEAARDTAIMEDAQRESVVSHPDEPPSVPARSAMKYTVLVAVAVAASFLFYNVMPTFGTAKPRHCSGHQRGNTMVYDCR